MREKCCVKFLNLEYIFEFIKLKIKLKKRKTEGKRNAEIWFKIEIYVSKDDFASYQQHLQEIATLGFYLENYFLK